MCAHFAKTTKSVWITCLLRAILAKRLWEFFLPPFKEAGFYPINAKGALIGSLATDPLPPKAKWIHGHLSKVIMWVLWNVGNQAIFEDKAKEMHNLIEDVQVVMFVCSMGNACLGFNIEDSL